MLELCGACRTSSIVTTQDCEKFQQRPLGPLLEFFVYVNAGTPVACVENILMKYGVQINSSCIE